MAVLSTISIMHATTPVGNRYLVLSVISFNSHRILVDLYVGSE